MRVITALVVIVRVVTHDTRRVLVDQGSSAEVMYYSLFKKLDLFETALQPSKVPLMGLKGYPVWPLGRIFHPLKVGSIPLSVEFVVLNVLIPYNAILGRNWLHGLKSNCIHLPPSRVVHRTKWLARISLAAKSWQNSATSRQSTSSHPKQVHWVESSDAPILEDIGSKAKEKATKDLVSIPINEDGTR